MDADAVVSLASTWRDADPDPETRAQTEAWLAAGDAAALADAFGGRLAFGTAGLRGAMGPGPNRMNRVLVRQVSGGLGDWLLGRWPDAREAGVVVGYDGRRNSRIFAEDAAAVLAGRGLKVWLAPHVVPTPAVGFAVLHLGACAGVVVTASHNPPADNGYKVFRRNGAQIIEPDDSEIAAALAAVRVGEAVPALDALRASGQVRDLPAETMEAWYAAIAALRVTPATGARIVYTAMHGVGAASVRRVLAAAGHTDVHEVAEQAEPDGAFPTVVFPNPEEPGALNLAMARADAVGADVILANDPDADRLAVAARERSGGWRQLTGNQVGVLLADHLLTHRDLGGRRPMVATTIVSSAMLAAIAAAHGAAYAETLTGFKWIGHQALAHDAAGGAFVLGFEEALGYSAGSVVRDKDGVSTLLLMADLASWCKARGQTLWDALDALYRRYGLYVSRQRALTLQGAPGKAEIARILATLRARPPASFAGTPVVGWRDLATGEGRRADGSTYRVDLPGSDVVAYDLADGSRVLVRPSGTEPKIKFYFEVREAVDGEVSEAMARGEARIAQMIAELWAAVGLS
jgi:phosphomannomutase